MPSIMRRERVAWPVGSLADEVVGADRMADFRPALCAPVLDEAGLAHIGPEAFHLAHRRVRGVPEQRNQTRPKETSFALYFILLKGPAFGSDVKINEPCPPQAWKVLRRGISCRRGAQKTCSVFGNRRPCRDIRRRKLLHGVSGLAVTAHRGQNIRDFAKASG